MHNSSMTWMAQINAHIHMSRTKCSATESPFYNSLKLLKYSFDDGSRRIYKDQLGQ